MGKVSLGLQFSSWSNRVQPTGFRLTGSRNFLRRRGNQNSKIWRQINCCSDGFFQGFLCLSPPARSWGGCCLWKKIMREKSTLLYLSERASLASAPESCRWSPFQTRSKTATKVYKFYALKRIYLSGVGYLWTPRRPKMVVPVYTSCNRYPPLTPGSYHTRQSTQEYKVWNHNFVTQPVQSFQSAGTEHL